MLAAILAALVVASPERECSPRLRPDPSLRTLVAEAAVRSPSIRALIDRLEQSNVVVYVRMRPFAAPDLDGRIGLVAAPLGGPRYLVIELACGRTELTTMATLAHELFHALEIADDASAVDGATLEAYYARAGIRTGDMPGRVTFETSGALAAGVQARRELRTRMARPIWTSK
jgi:hypothetical protein